LAKTDKELAVEIAKAYIEASSQLKLANGGSKNLIDFESVIKIIQTVHATLKKLD
jgi:hypothetical protein